MCTHLRGQFDLLPNPVELRHQQAEYVRLFSSLVQTYRSGKKADQREMLENAFVVRHLLPDEVRLIVRDWLDFEQAGEVQHEAKKSVFV